MHWLREVSVPQKNSRPKREKHGYPFRVGGATTVTVYIARRVAKRGKKRDSRRGGEKNKTQSSGEKGKKHAFQKARVVM